MQPIHFIYMRVRLSTHNTSFLQLKHPFFCEYLFFSCFYDDCSKLSRLLIKFISLFVRPFTDLLNFGLTAAEPDCTKICLSTDQLCFDELCLLNNFTILETFLPICKVRNSSSPFQIDNLRKNHSCIN